MDTDEYGRWEEDDHTEHRPASAVEMAEEGEVYRWLTVGGAEGELVGIDPRARRAIGWKDIAVRLERNKWRG